jgi:hypothetical protein
MHTIASAAHQKSIAIKEYNKISDDSNYCSEEPWSLPFVQFVRNMARFQAIALVGSKFPKSRHRAFMASDDLYLRCG